MTIEEKSLRAGAPLAVNGKPWVRAGLFCRRAG
jgi:hypothetical protein